MRMAVWVYAVAPLSVLAQSEPALREFRPFSATLRAQYRTESGRTFERNRTFARASDGSSAWTSDTAHPHYKEQRTTFSNVVNAPRRWYASVNSLLRATIVFPIVEDRDFTRHLLTYGTCTNLQDGTWTPVGRSTLLGFDVIEVEVERTERSLEKRWVAPALQCFSLKETLVTNGVLRTIEQAASIEIQEPDSALFEPPAGYAVLSPLEMEHRYQTMFGQELFGRSVHNVEAGYQRSLAERRMKPIP